MGSDPRPGLGCVETLDGRVCELGAPADPGSPALDPLRSKRLVSMAMVRSARACSRAWREARGPPRRGRVVRAREGGVPSCSNSGRRSCSGSAGDGPGARARGPGRRFEAGEGAGCAAHLRRVVPGEKGRPGARGADAGRGGVRRWGPTCGPLAGQFRGRLSRCVSGRRGGGRGWARPAGGGNLTSRGT